MNALLNVSLFLIARLGFWNNLPLGLATNGQSGNLAAASSQASEALPGQTATLLPDARWLVIGGEVPGEVVATAVVRDPRNGESIPVAGRLAHARAWHTATLVPSGTVLILGGVGSNGQVVDGAELFNPETQRFESLPSAGWTPRAHHTATLLTDGRVLIAGGVSKKGDALDAAELWDPRIASVIASSSALQAARRQHTAILLSNGSVLFLGGVDKDGAPLESRELYDPETRRFNSIADLPTEGNSDAPRLEASLPANGSTDVPIDSFLALRFSKPLRVETVNTDTVALRGPEGAVAARIVPAEFGSLAFVTPRDLLLPGSTYTLSLAGPTDGTDLSLPPTAVSFTTAGPPVSDNGPFDEEDGILGLKTPRDQTRASPWQSLPPLLAPPGVTALAGQVLKLNGQPLGDVTLQIKEKTARTDRTGRFLLSSIPPGHREMMINGRTASRPGRTYGMFEVGVNVTEGQTNVLPYTIWMPKIDTAHAVTIPSPTTAEVVVTTPRIPGLELRIPPGTVIRDYWKQIVTQISITPIPVDRPPFPLPKNVEVPLYFTVQPGCAYVKALGYGERKGARLIYPNGTHEPPDTVFDFWHYDPEEKGWYVYGQGRVTADGNQVVPDPGVAIYEFTGAMVVPPSLAPPTGPAPGSDAEDGDPVDLGTGLFVYEKTDLIAPDILPITLTRTYRQSDTRSRPFGIGTTHPYEVFLVGDAGPWTYVEFILPDGGRVRYPRISPGTQYWDAVYEHTSTPTQFYKSRVSWNGGGYDLKLKDGTVYVFPDAFGRTTQRAAALVGMRDRYGNALTLSRDFDRNLSRITSPGGRWIELTYGASNRITRAEDNIGRLVRYEYDPSGRLWKVRDPSDGVTEYTYDSSHRMLTIKNARNIVSLTNEYDAGGRVRRQIQADTGTYQFTYTVDGAGRVTQTEVTDPRTNVRRLTFSSDGYGLTDTYALGKPEQRSVTYERQAGTSLVQTVTDPLGRKTRQTYDPMGNVTAVTRLADTPQAITTSFTYEPAFNQLASIRDPLNHTTSFEYDGTGNRISVTDPIMHQTRFEYNAAGHPTSIQDPLGNTRQFGYESTDRVWVTNPLGQLSARVIDGAGRLTALTNALGLISRYEYDPLNRLVRATDSLQAETRFAYDPNGNLLSVTDARDGVTSYTPNSMDRVAARSDPLLRSESYQYDLAGKLRRFTDRKGQVTALRYDNLNRLNFVGFGTTGEGEGETYQSTISYTYDAADRLTQVVDSVSGTITLGYDDLDRLRSETTSDGTVSYTYDNGGRRQTMIVAGRPTVTYVYDDADRLTQIMQGAALVTIGYDDANRRTSLSLPDGIVMEYAYDSASRLTGITYKLGATLLGNLTHEYDSAGNRIRIGGTFARTGLPDALASAAYNAANQLTQWGGTTLTHDNNGNLTNDGVNMYAWDARNQLASIASGTTASFQYDAFGRRKSKTIGAVTTTYLYDGVNPVQERSGGAPTANLLTGLGIDEIFARTDLSTSRAFLTDGLGSTLALTDSSGTLHTQYTYDPFGKTAVAGQANTNPFQYTGRENDGSGVYFYRARFYLPSLHRFVSEDPIMRMRCVQPLSSDVLPGAGRVRQSTASPNQYVYVQNNPIIFRDPSGLDRERGFAIDNRVLLALAGPGDPIESELQGVKDCTTPCKLKCAGKPIVPCVVKAFVVPDLCGIVCAGLPWWGALPCQVECRFRELRGCWEGGKGCFDSCMLKPC